jgi:hypothetical protein
MGYGDVGYGERIVKRLESPGTEQRKKLQAKLLPGLSDLQMGKLVLQQKKIHLQR